MFDSPWDEYKIVLYWDCPHSYRRLVHQKIMILFVFGMHEYRCTLHGRAKMDYTKEGEKGLIAAPRFSSYWMSNQKTLCFLRIGCQIIKTACVFLIFDINSLKTLCFLYIWCRIINKSCVFFIFDVKSWKHNVKSLKHLVCSLYLMSNH